MEAENRDKNIKRFFDRIRLEDEVKTPAFDAMIPEKVTAAVHFPWHLASAAALVIIVGAALLVFNMNRPAVSTETAYEKWSALSNWKACTDSFLTIKGVQMQVSLTAATDGLLTGFSEEGKMN